MREMLSDLIAHKGYANAAMLCAIRHTRRPQTIRASRPPAARPSRQSLLAAVGAGTSLLEGRGAAARGVSRRARRPLSRPQEQESGWIETATDAELTRTLHDPRIPGGACPVAHAILQVCLHSQGHRAQCATLLRRRWRRASRDRFHPVGRDASGRRVAVASHQRGVTPWPFIDDTSCADSAGSPPHGPGHRRTPRRRLETTDGAATPATEFPRKGDFLIDEGTTYINAAYTHPIPKVSLEAVRRAAEGRCAVHAAAAGAANPRTLFAELINAKPTEIAYVSSTSAGENLVVQALGLDRRFDGNVVTDGLHFEGALLHLLELKKRGLDVRIVKPTRDYRIDLKDLERAVDRKTKLIEVSSASMYNGFQHDLEAVCRLAHAHGAYVYADIIHSAGAEPFDVKRERRGLRGVLELQVAHGGLRHRVPLRARGSARHAAAAGGGLLPGVEAGRVLSAEPAGRASTRRCVRAAARAPPAISRPARSPAASPSTSRCSGLADVRPRPRRREHPGASPAARQEAAAGSSAPRVHARHAARDRPAATSPSSSRTWADRTSRASCRRRK